MKKTSTILYTTAFAVMLAFSYPVKAQTTGGTGAAAPGPGTTTTSPGSTGNNATGRSSGNSTTANDAMSNTMSPAGWDTENTYWRSHYSSRPYYNKTTDYSAYEPAYRFGVDAYNKNPGKRYDELDQTQLRADWEKTRGTSTLSWEQAQDAARDSYNHMYESKNKSGASKRKAK